MNIYAILSSIPHNTHYLNRYINFVTSCKIKNEEYEGYIEKHHICPQAKDMFPEYKSLSKNPWNMVKLTPRQHYIAHYILAKAYPDKRSQKFSFFKMFHGREELKNNSKMYEKARIMNRLASSEKNKELVENDLHPFQGDRNPARRLAKEGKHHTQTKEFAEKRSKNEIEKVKKGIHNFLGENNPSRRSSREGTHNWLGGEHQRKLMKRLVDEGRHNWLGGNQQRALNAKRVAEGTHNWLCTINCVDRDGNDVMVPKEEYKKQQIGKKEEWNFVHRNSKEGYRRKGLEYKNGNAERLKRLKNKPDTIS